MRKPARLERRLEHVAPRAVALPLLGDVRVVAERGDHRGLHGRRRDEPEVLARGEQLADEVAAARRRTPAR